MLDLPMAIFFVIVGFITSFVSSVLGLGGGWLLTPLLHLMGLPMPVAAGTSLFTMLGSSFTSVWKHYSLKRIDTRLSVMLCIGSISGIQLSSFILQKLPADSISESLRWLFIVFLTMMLFSILFHPSRSKEKVSSKPKWWHVIFIILIGVAAGIFGGLLGVGGGFIVVPLLLYGLDLPKQQVVAASSLSILLASLSGTATYWHMGLIRLDYGCSLIIGALFGGYWAAVLLPKFKDLHIKNLFIQSLLLLITSLVLKQLSYDGPAKIVVFFTAGSLFLRMVFIIREHNKLVHNSDGLSNQSNK